MRLFYISGPVFGKFSWVVFLILTLYGKLTSAEDSVSSRDGEWLKNGMVKMIS